MNNNSIKVQTNNHICYAVNCNRKATNVIELEVGQFGKISLFLCRNCTPKFKLSEE
jgi:hypothetical protein